MAACAGVPWERTVDAYGVPDDPEDYSAEMSQRMLFDMLVDLKLAGTLSASKCCVLAFWVGQATRTNNTH
jgi:hypothetical protein